MKTTLLFKILFITVFFSANTIYAQDSDGDGILDSVDIDDDNDGILDTDECQNLLVDSGFNNRVGLSNGNNIGVDISPWILGSGDQSNIVKVDGAGGYNYGNGGPFQDANPLTTDGEDQYYLDIASGSNDFYQSFVVAGNAKLTYGGYFSSRDGRTGTGRLRIFTGSSGSTGTLVADSSTFSVSPVGGSSSNTPWQLFQDEFTVVAGTYSFVVSMDNDMNFDEGYTVVCYDTDSDGFHDYIDIDSDNDGIPDNVEAQTTLGYIPPTYIYDASGLDSAYSGGIKPVDTDGDGISDLIDFNSDNDEYTDIQENGMADTFTAADVDGDGLNNAFETNGVMDASLDVNEDIEDPTDLSILPDADGDLFSGGDLDYRDMFSPNPPSIASIDFDGIDDYLSRASFIDGLSDVTIMAWIKTDSGNSTNMVIAGEDTGCKLWLQNGNTPKFTIKTAGNSEKTVSCSSINFDEWHHVSGIYTSATGVMAIYIDGELLSSANVGSTGAVIENTEDSNGNFEVGRLSTDDVANRLYFKGDIDEVRVFDIVLTDAQLNKIVYQEIEDNSGNVKGAILGKDIEDTSTSNTIPWTSLIAYYPMTNIVTGSTTDYSSYGNKLYLNYIETVQDQTAPMPYVASNNGSWTSESTWEHGDVWDIENLANNKDWCIVKIANDVETSNSHTTLGLVIDSDKTLTVNGDNLIENTWYLELNGALDLQDDSQLIQTEHSDLVTSATGKVLRRQEGTPSAFWYNYWASPVGATGVTTLTDNNAATNNTSNTNFKLELLKDDTGFNCLFIPGYTSNGNISTYWLYTFINGITYWDWAKLTTTTGIKPGVGYTQKGTGIPSTEQQYIFEGKPNNGTILIDVTDTGGPGSVPSASKTSYLLGNPYTSALDIHKFIDDNAGVIDGTIHLWQQWSGSSHNLSEYNGGYAQVNKLGSIRAYQFVGIEGANNGSQDGTITPSRYLPVGQGFMTEIITDGTVEFNNTQRMFIKEADADGTYNNGSAFLKSEGTKTKNKNTSEKTATTEFQKIRLEFNSVTGPETRRELLIGFSESTTDVYDYGYDSENSDVNNNDLHLDLEGKDMNIQAYSEITNDKTVPLNFKSSGSNSFEIKITEKENIDDTQDIYLRDNLTGAYFDLTENTAYSFSSDQGKFNERFEIVFQSEIQTLAIAEVEHTENFIYYQSGRRKLYAKKLNASVDRFALINMLGQTVLELKNVSEETLNNGLTISNVASGSYIAYFRTDLDEVLTKKLIIN